MSGDENKLKKYRFPETLTNQSRYFGLPLDELIPAAICVGWGITTSKYLFGIGAAVLVYFGIKKLKKGRGSSWLRDMIYWYMPTACCAVFFIMFPIRVSGSGLNRLIPGLLYGTRCPFKYQSCNGHRFIFMSVLIVLSLSVNVIQGVNNYRLQNEQRTAVTPMAFNAPFAVSQNSADASYLQQMALSFNCPPPECFIRYRRCLTSGTSAIYPPGRTEPDESYSG